MERPVCPKCGYKSLWVSRGFKTCRSWEIQTDVHTPYIDDFYESKPEEDYNTPIEFQCVNSDCGHIWHPASEDKESIYDYLVYT